MNILSPRLHYPSIRKPSWWALQNEYSNSNDFSFKTGMDCILLLPVCRPFSFILYTCILWHPHIKISNNDACPYSFFVAVYRSLRTAVVVAVAPCILHDPVVPLYVVLHALYTGPDPVVSCHYGSLGLHGASAAPHYHVTCDAAAAADVAVEVVAGVVPNECKRYRAFLAFIVH